MSEPDLEELVHSALVKLPSGRHDLMFFVRPSDAEKLLSRIKKLEAEIERLREACKAALEWMLVVAPIAKTSRGQSIPDMLHAAIAKAGGSS